MVREKKGKRKININEKDELEIKPFTKRKTNKKEQVIDAPETNAEILRYKVRSWVEFNRDYFCRSGHYKIIKPKRLIDKKLLGQDKKFSTRLPYAQKRSDKFNSQG